VIFALGGARMRPIFWAKTGRKTLAEIAMIVGIEKFRGHFAGFEDHYALVGKLFLDGGRNTSRCVSGVGINEFSY
jgi:hypothetical protein